MPDGPQVDVACRVNGADTIAAGASDDAPARRASPPAAADRHQGRMRRRGVRRLFGAHRRRAREQLPRAAVARPRGRRSRRSKGVADRRRTPPRRAGGVHRARRRAVRHLHARDGPRGRDAARAHAGADARRDRGRRSPATCAGAPATRGSSKRADACAMRPHEIASLPRFDLRAPASLDRRARRSSRASPASGGRSRAAPI